MTPVDFCYWMLGFIEGSDGPPSPDQWQLIYEQLKNVNCSESQKFFYEDMIKDKDKSHRKHPIPTHDPSSKKWHDY
jgi:hypothetical protein